MILVASTIAAYKADGTESRWLAHAEAWREAGCEFFLAAQVGHGHDARLDPLSTAVNAVGGTVWPFSLDEHAARIDTNNRLTGIVTGRNLCHEHLNRHKAYTHLLLLDTDISPPADLIDRLLEVDTPIVGALIPTYGAVISVGRRVPSPVGDVRSHDWLPAGCLLIQRRAALRLRWRWSLDEELTDDPCFGADARAFGYQPVCRHDVTAEHWPPVVYHLDSRGHDLSIV